MKETDFPTKNCRSAANTTKTSIEKQRDFVVEVYMYHTKKYFLKLY